MEVQGKRSSLHDVRGGAGDLAGGGYPWRGLRGQIEAELADEELLVSVQFGVAAEDQRAAIGRGEVHVQHLDGGEFVEHCPGGEASCKRLEPGAQRDVQAVGQEGDEDVGFHALDQASAAKLAAIPAGASPADIGVQSMS